MQATKCLYGTRLWCLVLPEVKDLRAEIGPNRPHDLIGWVTMASLGQRSSGLNYWVLDGSARIIKVLPDVVPSQATEHEVAAHGCSPPAIV